MTTTGTKSWTLSASRTFQGTLRAAPDKSITHRAVLFASLADGSSKIRNPLLAEDTRGTIAVFQSLGAGIREESDGSLSVQGRGLRGWKPPSGPLDCGNSGTTMRLIAGVLSAQPFDSVLTGDSSLSSRPMNRVMEPLRKMGAKISGTEAGRAPLRITGGQKLSGLVWKSPVASAQVKSCVLLAGLYAVGETWVEEPVLSRDHTERMLEHFGIPVLRKNNAVGVKSTASFSGREVSVPGDLSSAAFFLVAGALLPGGRVTVGDVGVNPTRVGLLNVLERMGARVARKNERLVSNEPVADLEVEHSSLRSFQIQGPEIPALVDEIPILAVAATQAQGETRITGAQELRVKETDRLAALTAELQKMGADVKELPDGLVVRGPSRLRGAVVKSYGDHRMAMALAVAASLASGESKIEDVGCVDTSFPDFWKSFRGLAKE